MINIKYKNSLELIQKEPKDSQLNETPQMLDLDFLAFPLENVSVSSSNLHCVFKSLHTLGTHKHKNNYGAINLFINYNLLITTYYFLTVGSPLSN